MKMCPWEKIDDFQISSEFDRYHEWISEQVKLGRAEELPVQKPYSGSTAWQEKWFRHVASGQVWRLVWPDGPFTGTFEPVE